MSLTQFNIQAQRRAFILAQCNDLLSTPLTGRYKKTPHSLQVCPLESEQGEMIRHVLFYCQFYTEP